MSAGTLYMLPVTLGADNIQQALPQEVIQLTQGLETFIVENEKTARRFLGLVKTAKPVRELTLLTLNEHTTDTDLPALLAPLLAGQDVGLMSEAGCPGIADPGARLAALAHRKNIRVAPLVGPSSILLALMGSGLNGQRFAFLGYLPSDKQARIQRIKDIERQSRQQQETQIFIETPYRNQHLLEDMLAHCAAETRLCIARNISLPTELIVSKPIKDWKKSELPELHKQPTVFLLLA
ncbi:SAM-dependent methyltransferase [Methylobacillus flagellatus]|uniref:SAM-dependent methyltransferase n=1 Tax=Methylobacillus flagellatus TaxID=405 RepID=UPI002853883B|nr:SAM-dependent methyltransferase [Methylobacillus flagellatus]MDR5171470.1 SAM-dependent methyltransferase [Methylobacillus flagellatus]